MARRKDTEKPAQIIEAAFAVFGDIGFEGTLIKDIAERAGISSGTIYTYFQDKKDLFRATVREGWNRFLAQVRELAESPETPETRLQRFIDIGFSSLKTYLPLLRGMLFESSQMNLLQGSLEQLCGLAERLIV
ncbi:MAG: TetR/AcrR family transcriptional regulator, partial [Spirochaetia bacterium]